MKLLNKIKDKINHEIHGYKIVTKLTDEEYEKFQQLYMEWNIFAHPNDPMGVDSGSYDVFAEIGVKNKIPLDAFADYLHEKYGTDKSKHGILFGYIAERVKNETNK